MGIKVEQIVAKGKVQWPEKPGDLSQYPFWRLGERGIERELNDLKRDIFVLNRLNN
jgi:hypothetical protein